MKMQTAFDSVSACIRYSQLFYKTIKCTIPLLVCAFILTQHATAQTRSITGTVKGSAGAPLSSAGILIKGTKKGTLADEIGRFTIEAPANA